MVTRLAPPAPFPHLKPAPEQALPARRAQSALFRGPLQDTHREIEGSRSQMTTATWVTMIVIMAFVWGGLTVALRTAVRKESAKSTD